jgi:hypothetical protein
MLLGLDPIKCCLSWTGRFCEPCESLMTMSEVPKETSYLWWPLVLLGHAFFFTLHPSEGQGICCWGSRHYLACDPISAIPKTVPHLELPLSPRFFFLLKEIFLCSFLTLPMCVHHGTWFAPLICLGVKEVLTCSPSFYGS